MNIYIKKKYKFCGWLYGVSSPSKTCMANDVPNVEIFNLVFPSNVNRIFAENKQRTELFSLFRKNGKDVKMTVVIQSF